MNLRLIFGLIPVAMISVILLSGCVGKTISGNLDDEKLIIISSGSKGKDLAMMMCGGCHFDSMTEAFSGKYISSVPWYIGKVYSTNLTRSKNGVSAYQDTELERLIRFGISKNDKYIPFMGTPQISQQDLHSLITYFRSDDDSLLPSGELKKESKLTWMAKVAFWFKQRQGINIQSSPNSYETDNQGEYLVSILECYVCHSGSIGRINRDTPEKSHQYLRGGTLFGDYNGEKVISPSLISSSTELSALKDLGTFTRALRHGESFNKRKLRPPMPIYSNLNDKEVTSIYNYLTSLNANNEKE